MNTCTERRMRNQQTEDQRQVNLSPSVERNFHIPQNQFRSQELPSQTSRIRRVLRNTTNKPFTLKHTRDFHIIIRHIMDHNEVKFHANNPTAQKNHVVQGLEEVYTAEEILELFRDFTEVKVKTVVEMKITTRSLFLAITDSIVRCLKRN